MERMNSLADTGFIVALIDRQDSHHKEVKNIYLQQQKIIVPQSVLAEVAYLYRMPCWYIFRCPVSAIAKNKSL